jgi:hypothetical protein
MNAPMLMASVPMTYKYAQTVLQRFVYFLFKVPWEIAFLWKPKFNIYVNPRTEHVKMLRFPKTVNFARSEVV